MTISNTRLLVVVILLGLCGGVLIRRNRAEVRPDVPSLRGYPTEIAGWDGVDEPMSQAVLSVLGPGDFLSRMYHKPGAAPVELFVAYFPSQRSGDTIHSPKNCLPGSGWQPIVSGVTTVPLGGGLSTRATRYVVAKGDNRSLVIYWFQSHGRRTASEYTARFQLVSDAIRLNRTDGALIRFVTPVLQGESERDAERRAAEFIREAYPSLDRFIPL